MLMTTDGPPQTRRLADDEYLGPPRSWFVTDEWFERELEVIFRRRWNFAGHVDEIASKNAYITLTLGSDEVVVRRDVQGAAVAYYNVCPHRGARLCQGPNGTMGRNIVCPYHAWSFNPADGTVVNAPDMHPDFDPSPWGLTPVHVDIWHGLIFVSLGDDRPEPLAELFSGDQLDPFEFSRTKIAAKKEMFVDANWKVVMENDRECYHCHYNHPELNAVQDWRAFAIDPEDFDALVQQGRAGEFEAMVVRGTQNLNTVDNKTASAIPMPTRSGEAAVENVAALYCTGALLGLARDYGKLYVMRPVSARRTHVLTYWFVAADATEGTDYDLDDVTEFWEATYAQDKDICENVQRGMEMRAYRPGPLNRVHQGGQAKFYGWYLEAMAQARFVPDA